MYTHEIMEPIDWLRKAHSDSVYKAANETAPLFLDVSASLCCFEHCAGRFNSSMYTHIRTTYVMYVHRQTVLFIRIICVRWQSYVFFIIQHCLRYVSHSIASVREFDLDILNFLKSPKLAKSPSSTTVVGTVSQPMAWHHFILACLSHRLLSSRRGRPQSSGGQLEWCHW